MRSTTLILLLLSITTFAQPNFQWAKCAGRYTSHDHAFGIATDANGFSYITGEFQDTILFGSTMLINTTGHNSIMYIAKYDSNGNVIWAKIPGGNNSSAGNDVIVDQAGNFYVTGSFDDTLIWNGISLAGTALIQNTFLAKFDSSGNALWAKTASNYWGDFGNKLCMDKDENIYVTGTYEDSSITFGTYTIPCLGHKDVFLAKYDLHGNELWATNIGGIQDDVPGGVTTDAAGNVYVTGAYRNSLTAGTHTITATNNGAAGVFIIKYGTQGNALWAKSSGGFPSNGFGNDIGTDGSANCYVTGYFSSGEIYFDNDTLFNMGIDDIFILKYDSTGNLIWAKSAGGSDYDRANTLAVDHDGNAFVAGYIKSSYVSFGSFNLSAVHLDAFVTRYDSTGTAIWGKQSHGNINESVSGISLNGSDIYFCGDFSSTVCVLGNDSLQNSDQFLGSYDLYVAKLSGIITGIPAIRNNSELTIYPNPSSDVFVLRSNNSELKKMAVEIFDTRGTLVKSAYTNSREIILDRSFMSSGVYILRIIEDEKFIYNERIVIQ
jgi:hypothetical protein